MGYLNYGKSNGTESFQKIQEFSKANNSTENSRTNYGKKFKWKLPARLSESFGIPPKVVLFF